MQKIPEVSWIRHRDINLLTIGRYTYSNDQRFRAIHDVNTNDWTLRIDHVEHRDAGIYECQMSDIPHHISHYVYLNVVGKFTDFAVIFLFVLFDFDVHVCVLCVIKINVNKC